MTVEELRRLLAEVPDTAIVWIPDPIEPDIELEVVGVRYECGRVLIDTGDAWRLKRCPTPAVPKTAKGVH